MKCHNIHGYSGANRTLNPVKLNLNNARFETILKVFRALNAKISFNVELMNRNL